MEIILTLTTNSKLLDFAMAKFARRTVMTCSVTGKNVDDCFKTI